MLRREGYPVTQICDTLALTRSSFYHVVKRVVISPAGEIVSMAWRPPFTYRCSLAPGGGQVRRDTDQGTQHSER